jgi:cobalamin biosynthesis protein CobD/CbiB
VSLVALVTALLIEQVHALAPSNPVYNTYRRYVRQIERTFNAGKYQQGVIAWCLVVLPSVLGIALAWALLHRVGQPLALFLDIAVLYLTMGFRQFSHPYGEILERLRAGELDAARAIVNRWVGRRADEMSATELARIAIERGLFGSYRHVFAVVAWFAVFGAAGAVFYRLAAMLGDHWGDRNVPDEAEFGRFSRVVFSWCDWIPARLTAVSFAVVGDFEDAVYCWRTQSASWPDSTQGVILASGAGAIGVRIGGIVGGAHDAESRPELGLGDDADAELMTSAVGLIWRAVVVWLFVVLLVTVASWLG